MFNETGLVLYKKLQVLTTSIRIATQKTFQTNFAILNLLYNAAIGAMHYAMDISILQKNEMQREIHATSC